MEISTIRIGAISQDSFFATREWTDNTSIADIYIDAQTGTIYFPGGGQRIDTCIASISTVPANGYNLTSADYDNLLGTYLIKTKAGVCVKLFIGCAGSALGTGYLVVFNYLLANGTSFDH